MKRIKNKNIEIIVYEPEFNKKEFNGFKVITDIIEFKAKADIVVANRLSIDIQDIEEKVITRDLFGKDS